jgi:cytochrome c1
MAERGSRERPTTFPGFLQVCFFLFLAGRFAAGQEPAAGAAGSGAEIFAQSCSHCHGEQGQGIAAAITIAGPSLQAEYNLGYVMTAVETGPSHMPCIFASADCGTDTICRSLRGRQHANMHILLIAQQPVEFYGWLANQSKPAVRPGNPDEELGQQAFLAGPCSRCHTIRGIASDGKFGPDLTHIGSRKEIGADSFPNNNAYFEGWIANAQSLKPGCKMPVIAQYNGAQLRNLVAYLRELQ